MLKENFSNSKEGLEALYAMGFQLYENGKYSEAADVFRVLTALDKNERKCWFGFGAALHMQKKYDKALESYAYAALLDENEPYAHFHAAECFLAQGKKDEAFKILEIAKSVALRGKKKYNRLLLQIELIQNTQEN